MKVKIISEGIFPSFSGKANSKLLFFIFYISCFVSSPSLLYLVAVNPKTCDEAGTAVEAVS